MVMVIESTLRNRPYNAKVLLVLDLQDLSGLDGTRTRDLRRDRPAF